MNNLNETNPNGAIGEIQKAIEEAQKAIEEAEKQGATISDQLNTDAQKTLEALQEKLDTALAA